MKITVTVGALADEARGLLNDPLPNGGGDTNAYYKTATIARGVVDAWRRLCVRQPSVRYDANGHIDDVVFETTDQGLIAQTLTFDERWKLGLVYFAAARCHEQDIKDSVHQQLAQTLRQQAEAEFS